MDNLGQHTHVKRGAWRAKEVQSKSLTLDPKRSEGDRWWFWNQHLIKEPRTSGRAEKKNQEGRWPRAFPATPSARRNLSIWGKETSYENSISKPQNFEVSFLRSWGKNKKPWLWRIIWTYSKNISRKRKFSKWDFGYQSLGKWSKNKKRKGPGTNVLDLTLVMVPRVEGEWVINMEEP